MRTAIMALFALVVGSFFPASAVYAQTTKLDHFVGKDLWKKPLSKKDYLVLDELFGKATGESIIMEPVPWHIWKRAHDGETRYIVLLGKRLLIIPDGSSACVQLFDATANKMNTWSFQTGWRITFYDASIEYSTDLASDLILLQTTPVINGRNVAKEYFALGHDRLRFIRMEDDKGDLAQNEYVYPNYEIGFLPDANTVEQWITLLESKDKADVLSALGFLGGKHIDGPERRLLPGPHESEYVELYRSLIGNSRISALIAGLSNSDSEWIRQAAVLAARSLHSDPKPQN